MIQCINRLLDSKQILLMTHAAPLHSIQEALHTEVRLKFLTRICLFDKAITSEWLPLPK